MTKTNISPIYNGVEIRFDGELVNLTSMWKACGGDHHKKPTLWLDKVSTQEFMAALADNSKVSKVAPLKITKGRYGGTFAHWQIAMAYAKYLSPEFHIWCNEVVKERFEEMADPELGITRAEERAIAAYRRMGKSDDWIYRRLRGKNSRSLLTSTVIRSINNARPQDFARYTNQTYNNLFGMDAKEMREERGLKKNDRLRDYMDDVELAALDFHEVAVAASADLERRKYGVVGRKEFGILVHETAKGIRSVLAMHRKVN